MTAEDFGQSVLSALPYDPTDQQMMVIAALSRFIAAPMDSENRVFLLNGYAGTGKTSLVAAVVRALGAHGRQSVLLAPTGRAAKVFGNFAGRQAYTIHRRIYRGATSGSMAQVAPNRLAGAVYIVDEASMIGDSHSSDSLLDDLFEHVYTGAGCRLIMMGDTAQLPGGHPLLPGHGPGAAPLSRTEGEPGRDDADGASGLPFGHTLQRHSPPTPDAAPAAPGPADARQRI